MTQICIPLREQNIDILLEKIDTHRKKADIIEIWLGEIFPNPGDFEKYGEKYFQKIFEAKKQANNIPLVLNVKDNKEKGNFTGTDIEKVNILIKGVEMDAEYIDIDYEFNEELLQNLKDRTRNSCSQLILSAHFFKGTPTFPSLKNRIQKMKNSGADIIKIAAMPESNKDIISILRLSENLNRKNIPFIAMSMGKMGKFSRIMCPLLGSMIAFGSADKESSTAPGQMTADEMRAEIETFQ